MSNGPVVPTFLQVATVLAAWFGFFLGLANYFYNRNKDKPKVIVKPRTQKVKIYQPQAGFNAEIWKGEGVYLDIVNKRSFTVEIREAGLTLGKGSAKRFKANRPMTFSGQWLTIPDWPCLLEGNRHGRAEIDPHLHLDQDFKKANLAYVELVTGEVFYGKSEDLNKLLVGISSVNLPPRGTHYEWEKS